MHGVETISLDLSKLKRVHFISNVFAKMTRLRLLKVHSSFLLEFDDEDLTNEDHDVIIENASKMKLGLDFEFPSYELRYLCWDGYPLEFLPSNFDGENLIELHLKKLKCSNIKRLWQGEKVLLLLLNNEFFCFILILKFMVIIYCLLIQIFFCYRSLKG